VIFASMSRIALEYPDGNIAQTYGRQIKAWVGGMSHPEFYFY
jgi:hypothetical protein